MKIANNTLLGFVLFAALTCHGQVGDAQITLKLTDDSGNLLSGFRLGATFLQAKIPNPLAVNDVSERQVNSVADTNGEVVFSLPSLFDRNANYGADPVRGYYRSDAGGIRFTKVENGKWQPWNPTVTIVLKPVGVQVPMYAKMLWNIVLPETNKPIGYDLMIGDWVAPYGKGNTADFIFTLERSFTNVNQDFDATLTLTFSNEGDGIQSVMSDSTGSLFKIPRLAPETGYGSNLVFRMFRKGGGPMVGVMPDFNRNYFFRVRTKPDENGRIVSTLYGKIYRDIEWDIFHTPTAQLRFPYYLNPEPNSRNMEFDTKHNLLKDLDPLDGNLGP